ncbi:hypothetical protein Atep_30420 (plasmid) [Allochromatium tepidum]|uniref:Uncharacterized protein n=1 Tax=Allochromatium tepidum TaxID=553982 RepID=A0ABN6GEI6_9GAMM|nr:hypothetical protein Atep_30420 [Allochromatium tepidum]
MKNEEKIKNCFLLLDILPALKDGVLRRTG